MKKSWERYFALFALTAVGSLQAQPSGFQVVAGEASKPVAIDKNTLQIQTGKNTIIHWDSFSIGKNEVTKFVMPDKSSAVLNRVTGKTLSELQGMLQANGTLFLINPNGVLIGPEGQVNAASFFASTLDILNEDFLQKGELLFTGDSLGKVVNLGKIQAWDGDVVLIGRFIDNRGHIDASKGTAALAVGSEVLLKLSGNERVFIRAAKMADDQAKSESPGIDNTGRIEALQVELKADGNPYSLAIKDAGKIDALGLKEQGGRVFLVATEGRVEVTDSITANSGEVHILGKEVLLDGQAAIDVSGKQGGGTVLIGGDYQGKNPLIPNADFTHVGEKVTIRSDATENGNGGKIILWGTHAAQFFGAITARGGQESGDGGFVEISSKGLLAPRGNVDTRAPFGMLGQLLFDPCTVTISTNPTTMGVTLPGGVYDFDSLGPVNINNVDLINALNMSNVTINASATGTGAAAGNITLQSGGTVTWTGTATLTLIANNAPSSFIHLQDRFVSSGNTGFTNTMPRITLTSSNIVVGSATALNNDSGITINRGQIVINGGNLTVQGSVNNMTASGNAIIETTASSFVASVPQASIAISLTGDCTLLGGTAGSTFNHRALIATNGVGGNISVAAGGDIVLTAGSSAMTLISGASISAGAVDTTNISNLTLSANNYTLTGGSPASSASNTASLLAGSRSGNISLTANSGGNIILQAGTTVGAVANIATLSVFATVGASPTDNSLSITMNGGGFLHLLGGSTTNVEGASIFTNGPHAPITITGAGDVVLTSGTNDFANIKTQNTTAPLLTSPLSLTCNSLTLQNNVASTAPVSSTILTSSDNLTISPTTFVTILGGLTSARASIEGGAINPGNVIIHPMTGNLTITGGTGTGSDAGIFSAEGTITIDSVGGDVLLTAGSGGGAEMNTNNATGDITISEITGNLTLQGSTGTGIDTSIIANAGGNIDIGSIGGTATLRGGSMPNSITRIAVTSAAGNITFSGPITGDFSILGGSASNCTAGISTLNGDIIFSAPILAPSSLILTGGSTNANAFITADTSGLGGVVSIDAIGGNLLLTGGSPSASSAIITTNSAAGDITIDSIGGNLTLLAGSGNPSSVSIEATNGGDILIGSIGGTTTLTGGATANSNAEIKVSNAAGNVTFNGLMTGNVSILGGAGDSCHADISTFNGSISFSGGMSADLVITGGSGTDAAANIFAGGATGTVSISSIGGDLLITGGSNLSPASIESNQASGNVITIGTITGDLTVQGGVATTALAEIISSAGGNIVIGSTGGVGGTVTLTAIDSTAEIGVVGTGNISFNNSIGGGVVLLGGAGANNTALITTSGGNISFPAIAQNVTLTGGSGSGAAASIRSPAGTVAITSIGGDLILNGGTGASGASIFTANTTGNITIGPITGNLSISGGSAASAPAVINASSGGNISFGAISGTTGVTLTGGTTNSVARIAVNGNPGSVTFTNNIVGDLTLQGGSGAGATATISTLNGNITICSTPLSTVMNVQLLTGAGNATNVAISAGGTGSVSILGITDSLILTAQTGVGATANITAGLDITVNAGQNISLSSTNATSPSLTAVGSITTTTGLATNLSNTSFFQVGNAMSVTAGTNVNLQTASQFLGSTGPMTVTAGIDVSLAGASTFTHSGAADLTVTAGHDILLDGISSILFTTGTGNILATAGHNISLNATSTMSNAGSGLILGIAGLAVIVTDTSSVTTVSGDLTLVTDNDFPTPFGIGPGFFDLDATSTVTAGLPGTVRIYTAIRQYNTVDGLINGAPFVYGPEFVNSTTEQWLTWYLHMFVNPAPPTTILYKNNANFPPPTIPFTPDQIGKIQFQGGLAISQMFYMFTDEFKDSLYYFDIMKVMYDHKAFALKRHEVGVLTSYDVDPDLKLFIMRTKYMDRDGQLVPNYIYRVPR